MSNAYHLFPLALLGNTTLLTFITQYVIIMVDNLLKEVSTMSKPIDISRETYKQIKRMNRTELCAFLTEITSDCSPALDFDELREVIGSVNGIGEKRLDEIMNAIQAHYSGEGTEDQS